MKKRMLGLSVLMVAVFMMTGSVFGGNIVVPTNCDPYPKGTFEGYGENLGCGQCAECPKCLIGNIPCPTTTTTGQGQQATTALSPFDFDGEAWRKVGASNDANIDGPLGFGSYGYCNGFNYIWEHPSSKLDPLADQTRNCKFLFDICACPEACEVSPGTRIGIQMILDADGNWDTQDDGVYFAKRDDGSVNGLPLEKIYFSLYPIKLDELTQQTEISSEPCTKAADGKPVDLSMSLRLDGFQRYMSGVKYYRSYSEKKGDPDKNVKYLITMLSEGEPLGGSVQNIPEPNGDKRHRVVALESQIAGDYELIENDTAANCLAWIDIPPVRIDPVRADVLKGKTIRVKVRLMFNRGKDTVCPECYNYCECIVEIAKVCCDTVANNCLFFPYVVQKIEEDSNWAAGIAITARETLPANAYAKLTLIDASGNTATYTNSGVSRIWTFMLNDVMPNFTGAAISPGAASLKVETNYSVHGYSFLTDGNFGAGTLAAGCTPGQCCP